MRILRVGERGREKPALLDDRDQARDLSHLVADFTPQWLSEGGLEALGSVDIAALPMLPAGLRIGAPLAQVGKIVCVGLNYRDHATEAGLKEPKEPILFLKAAHTVQGPNDDVRLPRGSRKTDWEVELGVVIGRRASYVSEAQALDHVAGYCVCNDLSEREFQIERGGQWDKGKNCETFGPLGPWIVSRDAVPDPQRLGLTLDVNGRRYQDGTTADMIFGVAFLVHYISQFMPLEPGDVISTGTPAGVGMGQKPPAYLNAGDRITVTVAGLGTQNQTVLAPV